MTDIINTILEIRNNIKTDALPNEASISQVVVLRILKELHWPIYSATVVFPEFVVSGRRVDFALCYPEEKPVVFIEVKKPGHTEGADKQLFEYAYHEGVPMAILTDGQEWNFYLPAERGHYDERRVYKLDVLERSPKECVHIFSRYLLYEDICSGQAIEAAKADYKNVARRREIEHNIPVAWSRLFDEPDEFLVELLSEKVEILCGYRPDQKSIVDFLTRKPQQAVAAFQDHKNTERGENKKRKIYEFKNETRDLNKHKYYYSVCGKSGYGKNAIDVLISILSHLADMDSQFLDKFCNLPKHGTSRRYISRNRRELYTKSPHLFDKSREIIPGSGWWIGTNLSNDHKMSVIKLACEISGLMLDRDIIVNFNK